jgi:hypothetical protein
VLIVLRIYLQIYVEHSEWWGRLAQSMSIGRAPMLVPLQHPLIRSFSGLIFYLLLPLIMLFFAWKAAVFPALGSGVLGVPVAVVASHIMLPLKKFSRRSKARRRNRCRCNDRWVLARASSLCVIPFKPVRSVDP